MGKKKMAHKNVRPTLITSEQELEQRSNVVPPPPPPSQPVQQPVAQPWPMVPLSVLTALLQAANPNADWSTAIALLNLPGTVPAARFIPAQTAAGTSVTVPAEPTLEEGNSISRKITTDLSPSVPETEEEGTEKTVQEEEKLEEKVPQEAKDEGTEKMIQEEEKIEEGTEKMVPEEIHTGDHSRVSSEEERPKEAEETQEMMDEARTEDGEAVRVAEGLDLAPTASSTQEVQHYTKEKSGSPTPAEVKPKK